MIAFKFVMKIILKWEVKLNGLEINANIIYKYHCSKKIFWEMSENQKILYWSPFNLTVKFYQSN